MKKILLATLLALGTIGITTAIAQVNVNVNIGNQPAWGPVGHNYVQYYYIPEYNIYYDVLSNRYVYLNNRRWIHAAMLPPHLRHIDLYRTHKVVINQHNPFRYNDRHVRTYSNFRNHGPQIALRDRRIHDNRNSHGVRHERPKPKPNDRFHDRNDRKRLAQHHQNRNERMPNRDNNRGPRR